MNKREFIKHVQERVALDSYEVAEEMTRVVLSLLSHRLTPEESRDIEAQLSKDMKGFWHSDTWLTNFLTMSQQYQLRYRKKAELYSLIDNEAARHQVEVSPESLTTAVFHVLKQQITPGEIRDVAAQLPKDIEAVWVAA